ncbi:MAG: tetratricopeptide repeat protein [Planctomycetota bacterium]|nr:tetratricopeptide repeat protein [Planctomycetota bacterium]
MAGEDEAYLRAHHLYTLQEYQMAAEAFTKYLASFPKSERAGDAHLFLAESYYQLKDYAKSAQAFARFVQDQPTSPRRPEALQRAVKVNALAKDYEQSMKFADLFLKENRPKLGQKDAPPALPALFESVLYYAGDAAYAAKKPAAARGYWESLLKDFPASRMRADAAEGLGWVHFDAGEFEAARNQFTVTAHAPEHGKAAASQVMAARCLDQLGKTDEALAALEKAAGLKGGKEQARNIALEKTRFLLHARRYEAGLAQAKAQIKDAGPLPETAAALAEAAVQAEADAKPADALALAGLYLESFAKGDDRSLMASIKARALAGLNRRDEALAAAQAALAEADALPAGDRKNNVERPAALMLLADLAGAEGAKQYEAVVKDHPQSRFAHAARYQLAYLAGKAGRIDEALAHAGALLKVLQPAEGDKEGAELRRKTLFAAGDFAFRKPDFERAEVLLKEYANLPEVKADPARMQLGLVNLRIAWCRQNANDPAGAAKLLDAALPGEPKGDVRAEMLYLRGQANLKLKDAAKAQADFKLLIAEAPQSNFADFAAYEGARADYEAGKFKEAAAWLDAPLAKPAPADAALLAESLLLRAKARYKAGLFAEAIADADAALKRSDGKERANPARLVKALSLEGLPGKEAEAEAAYAGLISSGPAETPEAQQALLRRGQIRFAAKRFAEAKDDYAAYLAKNDPKAGQPDAIQAAVRLAICLKETKDAAGAQAQLDKLAQLNLDGAAGFEVPFQLGNVLYEAGKHAEAAAQYRKALDAAKAGKAEIPLAARSAAWLNLAWSCARSKEPKQAEAAFAELLALDPAGPFSAEARYHRGRLLDEAGQVEAACALWKELLEKQPKDALAERALAALADAQAKTGKFADAAASYEKYLAAYPAEKGAREAWCGLAECRLQIKKPDAAREAFLKALGEKGLDAELDEVSERAVLGMSELALSKGEAAEAKKLALRVVLDRPDSKWLDAALYLCGRASEDLAEPEKAIGYFRKLLTDRPQSPRAATAEERLKALGAPASKP